MTLQGVGPVTVLYCGHLHTHPCGTRGRCPKNKKKNEWEMMHEIGKPNDEQAPGMLSKRCWGVL